ncbi:MAG TPA: GAF domain-containing sensor histidine kinase [Dehalococcoidia bacterium]|nr:GAF domain-containing sensor histidine kinase [Dehalococcoidia bacterium]
MPKTIDSSRLQALLEASRALVSELDIGALLQRIADLARSVIEARYAAVGVLDDRGRLAEFVYSGLDDETARKIGHLPEGIGVLGTIIEEGRTLRLEDVSQHPDSSGFPPHHPPMRSFLGVPIKGKGGTFGRLYLTDKIGRDAFDEDDESLATMFAAQSAVAVENARLYDEVASRSDQLGRRMAEIASVERVGGLLTSFRSLDETLEAIVVEACRLTGARRCGLGLVVEETGETVFRWTSGDEDAHQLTGLALHPGSSKAHFVMQRRRGEVVNDLLADTEIQQDTLSALGDSRRLVIAPLLLRDRSIGVLSVYNDVAARRFTDDDLTILQVLANQAVVAIENDRLQGALKDLAVLEERDRISRELHDGVIQSIYSVGLSLQGSLSTLARDPERARERIDEAIIELDNVVRDVRSYIFELRPSLVEEKGLAAAIKDLAQDFEVNTLAHTQLKVDEEACGSLPAGLETHVIQIVREVLSNIARHAGASRVTIEFLSSDGDLSLTIDDNGKGFELANVRPGHGLANIESRVMDLSGHLEITGLEKGATRHKVRFPAADAGAT